MTYKVQFNKGWAGTWVFDATDDVGAWKKVWDKIHEQAKVIIVGIEDIYEIDDSETPIRKLPEYEDCEKISVKQDRKKAEKQDEQAIYKAYFSDGECSGPYIAKVSENNIIALEIAEYKLKQYIEYNKLDITKIKLTQVEELNEDMNFTVNVLEEMKERKRKNKKGKKENRFLSLRST